MFQARPTNERYVTGGGGRASVTLCEKGERGVKIDQIYVADLFFLR